MTVYSVKEVDSEEVSETSDASSPRLTSLLPSPRSSRCPSPIPDSTRQPSTSGSSIQTVPPVPSKSTHSTLNHLAFHPHVKLIFTIILPLVLSIAIASIFMKSESQTTVQQLPNRKVKNTESLFVQMRKIYGEGCPKHEYHMRLVYRDPRIIYVQNFLSKYERLYLLTLAAGKYQRTSFLWYDQGPEYRTPRVASVSKDPVAECIIARGAEVQGHSYALMEDLQLVKYGPGEQYIPHYDNNQHQENPRRTTIFAYTACDLLDADYEENRNRSKTDREKAGERCRGGETHFPYLSMVGIDRELCDVIDCHDREGIGGVLFKPIPGNAIYWSNLHVNGSLHHYTKHAGLPIKEGRKIGINIWSRTDGPKDKRLPLDKVVW